mgnify:FL=1
MKKFIYSTVLLLALTSVKAKAQTFMDQIHFEVTSGAGIENKGITPIDFSFKTHVEFVSISYLFVTAEDNVSLYNNDGIKTYP